MKIAAYVHGFYPKLSAGSERMLLNILKEMQKRGHECKVITPDHVEEFEGVPQVSADVFSAFPAFKWADIIITHHQWCGKAINIARDTRRPLAIIVHNTLNRELNINAKPNNRIIYNSDWVRAYHNYDASGRPGITFHPQIPVIDYETKGKKDRKYITLVNCTELKGGEQFKEIARLMPDHKFLAVNGGYGAQVITEADTTANLKVIPMQLDMKVVYRQSRIVLMPSRYESYGMVAIEAFCSGIPVIANPTPGLKEAMQEAGIYAERENIQAWVEAIKALDNETTYKEQSESCRKRAELLDDSKYYDDLETFLTKKEPYIQY